MRRGAVKHIYLLNNLERATWRKTANQWFASWLEHTSSSVIAITICSTIPKKGFCGDFRTGANGWEKDRGGRNSADGRV
jgi:hypothetical protein